MKPNIGLIYDILSIEDSISKKPQPSSFIIKKLHNLHIGMIIETDFLKWWENLTYLKLWMSKVPLKFVQISKNRLAFSRTEKTVLVPYVVAFVLGPCTFENAGLNSAP